MTQEVGKGRKWDENRLKSRYPGDKQTANFMRQDVFNFWPQCKLWPVGNNKPSMSNVDKAVRRRVRLIAFLAEFDKGGGDQEVDMDLEENLFREEGPGILAFFIEGAGLWY